MGTANFKAPGGLIRVTVEDVESEISEIIISGDFFMLPIDAITRLERSLIGVGISEKDVLEAVKKAYADIPIESPGIAPEDIATAIKMAVEPK